MNAKNPAGRVLFLNTLAFAVCFAAWTLYGVLITYLMDHHVLTLDKGQVGLLIGVPILTGSALRLPVGILADRFGGKPVYVAVMLITALALFATSFAGTFTGLLLGGLAFGISGASFAVGVAYTSSWFPKYKQGTALGLFGMGNMGTAITALAAPSLLDRFTQNGSNAEGWRKLPQVYAITLILMAAIFALFAIPRKTEASKQKTLGQMLSPLKYSRVWRFGLYYFVLFGGFVALSQWLIPYYLNVYGMTLASAGLMATMFSLPSGLTRALGGFLSDKVGARTTLYLVLSGVALLCLLLVAPKMEITSPGEGVLADKPGVVSSVATDQIIAAGVTYKLKTPPQVTVKDDRALVWPRFTSWQEPTVKVGDVIKKKQVLAKGLTHVYFQANQGVFTVLLLLAGVLMGLGMAAVYKHIPEYFPEDVGVVGGLVGVLGGLGGFVLPILFGYLLKATGLWTTCWLLIALLAVVSLVWMHLTVLRMVRNATEEAEIRPEAREMPRDMIEIID